MRAMQRQVICGILLKKTHLNWINEFIVFSGFTENFVDYRLNISNSVPRYFAL